MSKYAVFVYGTLKSGYWNNQLLEGSQSLGCAVTTRDFCLIDGPFPYACRKGSEMRPVIGEVYLVNREVLERLDRLEGVPHHYQRRAIGVTLDSGTWRRAYMYTIPEEVQRYGRPICPTDEQGRFFWEREER